VTAIDHSVEPLVREALAPAVSFFQEREWSPERALQPEVATYYRKVLAVHANGPETGACSVCQLPTCPDWRDAYDRLAAAGEPMAPSQSSRRRRD